MSNVGLGQHEIHELTGKASTVSWPGVEAA